MRRHGNHIARVCGQSSESQWTNSQMGSSRTWCSGQYPSKPALHQLLSLTTFRQNYTCADSTADSKPAAIGALASLFDATCIAANYPDIMAILPNAVVSAPVPTGPAPKLLPANLDLLGHHYFQETTPVFNLDTTPKQQNGIAFVSIGDKISAPVGSYPGVNNQGAVSWLYLPTMTDGTVGKYSSVYRVNTAGGSPPATCEGMPPVISVDYAANYYFFDF